MKLDDAVRALREEGSSPLSRDRKRSLRERIVASRPARSKKIAWVLPIAAALAATTVYASVSRHWFSRSESTPVPVPSAGQAPVVGGVGTATATVASNAPPIVESATTTTTTTTSALSPAPKPSVDNNNNAAEDPSLVLYRDAERLQRVEKDCARAVPAWDVYLARAGSSPLAVDARFSRAICLVRLGRSDEARGALAPFARGESGSYRQSEAQSLLDELNGEAGTGH